MTCLLAFEQYLAVIESAAATLAGRAVQAGLDAPVPTCPRWSIADLVAHQGMVHRWAATNLRMEEARVPSKSQILEELPVGELVEWFAAGAQELLATLRTVDPDVPAMVFLNEAPSPRVFWARRQAHETMIHAVDALAGALGRTPSADEAGTSADVALDGIDELLTGFFTRGQSRLADGDPFTIALAGPATGPVVLIRTGVRHDGASFRPPPGPGQCRARSSRIERGSPATTRS